MTLMSLFRSGSALRAGMARSAILCSVIVLTCVLPAASPCLAADKAAAVAQQMAGGVNILGYDGIWGGGVDAPFKRRYFKMILATPDSITCGSICPRLNIWTAETILI